MTDAARVCQWCGVELVYSGRGRPRTWCCASHRQRGHIRQLTEQALATEQAETELGRVATRPSCVAR